MQIFFTIYLKKFENQLVEISPIPLQFLPLTPLKKFYFFTLLSVFFCFLTPLFEGFFDGFSFFAGYCPQICPLFAPLFFHNCTSMWKIICESPINPSIAAFLRILQRFYTRKFSSKHLWKLYKYWALSNMLLQATHIFPKLKSLYRWLWLVFREFATDIFLTSKN